MPWPIRSGRRVLDHLADLGVAVLLALLADVDRHAEAGVARLLDERRELAVRVALAARARAGDVDADDPARRVADRLLDDDRVLLLVEGAVHHQDQPDAHQRVLEARAVEPADRGHDDVVEVALAAAVPLHRVEAQLERRDVLRAVGAADRRVHRALDRERARLDQLRPVVDLVEGVERVDAARVGDRDEPVELPVVLDRERDALLVGEAPHDLGGDRRAEVGVELGEALLEHGSESSRVWGGRGRTLPAPLAPDFGSFGGLSFPSWPWPKCWSAHAPTSGCAAIATGLDEIRWRFDRLSVPSGPSREGGKIGWLSSCSGWRRSRASRQSPRH